MKALIREYTFQIVQEGQEDLIQKAARCLARAFIGTDVAGTWIQEPMVGQLSLNEENFYTFTYDYLQSVVAQGYCVVALNAEQQVVGVLAGDTHIPEIADETSFHGPLADMNVIIKVLNDVTGRFIIDYEKRKGGKIREGQLLHLFMLGVLAEQNRQEIVQQLAEQLFTKAKAQGIEAVIGEATNPKSMRLMEKFFSMKKYQDDEGNFICHLYQHNAHLKGIPLEIADGTYMIIREL